MEPWQNKLISIFQSQVNLPDADVEALLQHWTHRQALKRNDCLIEKGQTELHLFYVCEGAMRIYYPHHEDEICVGFAYDHSLICSYPSFIQQKSSGYYIQALRKTEVVAIHRRDFYGLFDNHRLIERAWRMLQEEALMGKIERETEMLTFTPEERYSRLQTRSPQLFQIIPRKYIASYLRMTPETLSRLKPD